MLLPLAGQLEPHLITQDNAIANLDGKTLTIKGIIDNLLIHLGAGTAAVYKQVVLIGPA
jgi:hypothetical protein